MSDKKYTIKDWLSGKIGVVVETEQEYDAMMDIAEKAGIRWLGGQKPKQYEPWLGKQYIELYLCDGALGYSEKGYGNSKTVVEFKSLITIRMETNSPSYALHITSAGNITHAVLKQDGKVIKRSMATCHPDAKYDFLTGARTALDRMQGKKPLSLEDVPTEKLVEELSKRKGVKRKDLVNGALCIGVAHDGGGYYGIRGLGPGTVLLVGYGEGKSK